MVNYQVNEEHDWSRGVDCVRADRVRQLVEDRCEAQSERDEDEDVLEVVPSFPLVSTQRRFEDQVADEGRHEDGEEDALGGNPSGVEKVVDGREQDHDGRLKCNLKKEKKIWERQFISD